jgi:dolichol-phosphate mannosyltransferase
MSDRMPASQLDLSIVVPTYREAANLPVLVPRVADALNSTPLTWELIVVDDNSPDETVSICRRLAESYPVRLIVRTAERGLSSAVIAGMRAARGDILLCMDADLSHPPESIPTIASALGDDPNTDFVIGSRYVQGGRTEDGWGLLRWINSRGAILLARPLTRTSDPMAGFFALRRNAFHATESTLNPVGYKIGLELLIKCGCRHIVEVPIHFSNRLHGASKLTLREQLN